MYSGNRPFAVVIVALIFQTHAVTAQAAQSRIQPPTPTGAVIGGLLAGGIGFAGGAIFAAKAACPNNNSCHDFEALGAAIVGSIVGEIVFLPIGVHIGNGRSGSLGLDVLASVFGGVGALALGVAADNGAVFLVGVGAQIAFTVATERMKGRNRSETVALVLQPATNGRIQIGARVKSCLFSC